MARRGNTSIFWSNFGPFLKIQSGTWDFLDFFVNSRVSPSHSRVSPLRWDRQHTLIPYVLGLGSPIPAAQAAPPGIAIPIPIPSHSHPIITHTRDTQSFIPALRAGGRLHHCSGWGWGGGVAVAYGLIAPVLATIPPIFPPHGVRG